MFQGSEQDPVTDPVDVLKSQCTHLAAAYTVGIKQLADGIITPPRMVVPINALKQLECLLVTQTARHC